MLFRSLNAPALLMGFLVMRARALPRRRRFMCAEPVIVDGKAVPRFAWSRRIPGKDPPDYSAANETSTKPPAFTSAIAVATAGMLLRICGHDVVIKTTIPSRRFRMSC